jgi:deazaflavin-dependent oxidoreductase (nitroreductase family)
MSVTLPPNGTRGVVMPKFALPLMKAGMGLSHLVFRMLGDRMRIQGQTLLMLTTVGARTGKRRHSILARFADPGRPGTWLVVGSNGGLARHPSWCYNLAKNPEQVWIKIGKQDLKVHPDSLPGSEREEAWKRVVSLAPGYAPYETKTDREIPIIRLTPASSVV